MAYSKPTDRACIDQSQSLGVPRTRAPTEGLTVLVW